MELLLAFIVALGVTAAAMPLLARWAPSLGLTDAPGPRKVHAVPVPRVGGIGMALGGLLPMFMMSPDNRQLHGLLAGLLVLLVFGIWDDRRNLGYRTKLMGQVIAILLALQIGDIRIESLTLDSRFEIPGYLSWALTFFFLLGVTNAVNLADGLDGLAGGMALLCCSAIALLAATVGNIMVAGLAVIQCGSILGFLRFNVHPARVFMGDCGSQMLGFNMGALAILVTQGETTALSAALPLLLVGVPIFDTFAVMWTRIREGRSPFSSDRNHLHHRLMALGFGHGDAVISLSLLQILLFLLAYFLRFAADTQILIVFIACGAVVLGLIRYATSTGWNAAHTTGPVRMLLSTSRVVRQTIRLAQLPMWSLRVCVAGLVVYSLLIVATSSTVSPDIGLLSLVLLIALLLLVMAGADRSLRWLERVSAYVSVVVLVYLDQTGHGWSAVPGLSWMLLSTACGAALLRFWLVPANRFEVTSLDVLMIFIAIIVPNLPAAGWMPQGLASGVAKAALLLYVVEMLLSLEHARRSVPLFIVTGTLAAIALRALVAAV